MILKERNSAEYPETDIWSRAGAAAEEQMAFYLRRMFLNDQNIHVFNDMRFKDDTGDSAQIDHLVLHRHGFVIVESKSVSSGVAVNEHGEWVRFWDKKPQGMPSPIQQAKFQVEFLRRALGANVEFLLDKMMFGRIQQRFTCCPFDVLVAISDNGSIKRTMALPEVIKADQVADRIKQIYERHRKASNPLNITASIYDGVYKFTDAEMTRIGSFLLEHHYPLTRRRTEEKKPVTQPVIPPESKPEEESSTETEEGLGLCEKCGEQSAILWGNECKSYYWSCMVCGHNMPIRES